ncbi:MAG TPA: hypothetical protein VFC07_04880, partial [Verrucomicrobiae bacterium]|nr:hypothetical protein [Verrucomicrobiae bacterium]
MNPDLPPNPRAQLEARLTAYLLGELPAHEAAAVRQAMDEDAQLAALCERLKPVIQLVRATAANPAPTAAASSTPIKLSEERRQKLFAHFKTVTPKEFVRPPRRQTSWLVPIAAAAVLALLLAALVLPSFQRASSKARSTSILNNLRQLDGAKQTWAMENKKSPTDAPTFEDLKPYMGRGTGGFPESIAGEKY